VYALGYEAGKQAGYQEWLAEGARNVGVRSRDWQEGWRWGYQAGETRSYEWLLRDQEN
jgi:hypothetical protein